MYYAGGVNPKTINIPKKTIRIILDKNWFVKYNTDINIIGGIPDFHLVIKAMDSFITGKERFEKLLVAENYFGFRTEEARGRFMRVLSSSILKFENDNQREIFRSILQHPDTKNNQFLLIIWQMAINNPLFLRLMNEVYFKFYFNGKVSISNLDVLAYLLHLKETEPAFKELNWSKKTLETVASKFLTFLKKAEVLSGSQKKKIELIQLSDQYLTFVLYLIYAVENDLSNLYKSKFMNFCFIPQNSLFERIKGIARKDWIRMSFTGDRLKVEPIIDYKDLAHVVYYRT